MLKWKIFQSKGVAIGWLLFISFLFVLPGSALPKEAWLEELHPDKWVHVGLFAILVFLWRSAFAWNFDHYNFILLFFALLYGLLVELVQKQWIPYRSFDLYDVMADMGGSFLGLLVWYWVYRKK